MPIRFLLLCVALLSGACSDKPALELGQVVDRFCKAGSVVEMRDAVFLPADLDQTQADRIIKQCLLLVDAMESPPTIQNIEVKGSWARVELVTDQQAPIILMALRLDGEWRIFWDPAGTLVYGKQPWHAQLSESDWKDYRALDKVSS